MDIGGLEVGGRNFSMDIGGWRVEGENLRWILEGGGREFEMDIGGWRVEGENLAWILEGGGWRARFWDGYWRNLQNLVAIGAVEIFTAIGIVATNITLLSVGGEEISWINAGVSFFIICQTFLLSFGLILLVTGLTKTRLNPGIFVVWFTMKLLTIFVAAGLIGTFAFISLGMESENKLVIGNSIALTESCIVLIGVVGIMRGARNDGI
ncbi:uncharacterized protein LOC118439434 [Folsomia candida]|uniref:uncharacterized protein LOC118439434 n=1 Tax=Folsomia candida TaxID=158441 RepID=UPI001604ADF9|nr:uncharacterized protein LOC118439434 [Folsomia candida]